MKVKTIKRYLLGGAVSVTLAAGASQANAAGTIYAPELPAAQMMEISRQCSDLFPRYERKKGIPMHLLDAVALTESGRWHEASGQMIPWPWAVHARGNAYYMVSKEQAERFVAELISRGERNIDVGCMQVNLHFHSRGFDSVADALDPRSNIRYATGFLKANYKELGGWREAIAAYHSRTPLRGRAYANKVMKHWHATVTKRLAAASQPLEQVNVAAQPVAAVSSTPVQPNTQRAAKAMRVRTNAMTSPAQAVVQPAVMQYATPVAPVAVVSARAVATPAPVPVSDNAPATQNAELILSLFEEEVAPKKERALPASKRARVTRRNQSDVLVLDPKKQQAAASNGVLADVQSEVIAEAAGVAGTTIASASGVKPMPNVTIAGSVPSELPGANVNAEESEDEAARRAELEAKMMQQVQMSEAPAPIISKIPKGQTASGKGTVVASAAAAIAGRATDITAPNPVVIQPANARMPVSSKYLEQLQVNALQQMRMQRQQALWQEEKQADNVRMIFAY